MEFVDLRAQYAKLKNEIDAGILEVCNSAQFIGGNKVEELEEQLAEYVGVKYCVTCGNGTDALFMAMMSYGIGHGDAVFLPTFTFYASAETISLCGATPIFIDIDVNTFNISAEDLEKAILEVTNAKIKAENGSLLNPKAIMAVDLFGLPANFKEIRRIAEKYNLLVIEDGAQGFGGSMEGKMACSLGDIATTSFFPAKPLGCYGDGGAIFTDEVKVKNYLESLRVHGKGTNKYDNVRVGLNSRLDAIQAAVLLPKLKEFKSLELKARRSIAQLYNYSLKDTVTVPTIPENFTSSFAQYSILLESEEERNQMVKTLANEGIPTMVYYKKSMHQQTVYRNNSSVYRGFPKAERVSQTILNLPMHPYLSREDVKLIVDKIKG